CGTREGDVVKILDFGSAKDKSSNKKKLTQLGTTIGSPFYMSPEQAQGLESIDKRADVFALAAVTYECITGSVPFSGTNGPSILLAILTKDPVPPTQKAAGSKYPVPPAIDEVLEVGLAKNQNIRTQSVGALADAVGQAYGLTGDHRLWATVPQQELARQLAEALPRVMAPPVAAADPFAMPGAAGPMSGNRAMDAAFGAVREADVVDGLDGLPGVAGLPARKPGWVLPVVVGLLALVVGGAVTLVMMK
ncbi:MAG: serine/threonine protein kinase, partial [Polyangiaceae bacterium]